MADEGAGATTPTLYEWAGGLDALRRMIDAFYDRVEQVEMFDRLFPGGVTEEQRATFVATMSIAADDAGLPGNPEFRSALLPYNP